MISPLNGRASFTSTGGWGWGSGEADGAPFAAAQDWNHENEEHRTERRRWIEDFHRLMVAVNRCIRLSKVPQGLTGVSEGSSEAPRR